MQGRPAMPTWPAGQFFDIVRRPRPAARCPDPMAPGAPEKISWADVLAPPPILGIFE